MFRTTAPVRRPPAGADTPAAVPRIIRAARHTAPEPGGVYEPDPVREGFFREMGAPYGASFDRERYAASGRRTSVELAYGALDALGPLSAQECPEVVVVAYATPDFEHAELVASCLKRRLPGEPLSFALSDQGVLAPFSALRVAVEYARRCGFRRLLVMIVDQGTQPYAVPDSGQAAVRADAAVALLVEWPGGEGAVRGMAQGRPSAEVFTQWDERAAVVAGAGLPARGADEEGAAGPTLPPRGEVVARGALGQPCTGVWTALLEAAAPARHLVVADYDRERDFLAYCTLDTGEWGTADGLGRGA
ncbi:hypothetical protein ABZY36_15860 [Streptomyces sp. NPDC006627]|uniref:hypothetical protein n=1 Tax=Streptomyces sp. NPDC006627 TaxID=3154679 RepID=UPI0033BC51F8